jgi:hypothetical protein
MLQPQPVAHASMMTLSQMHMETIAFGTLKTLNLAELMTMLTLLLQLLVALVVEVDLLQNQANALMIRL